MNVTLNHIDSLAATSYCRILTYTSLHILSLATNSFTLGDHSFMCFCSNQSARLQKCPCLTPSCYIWTIKLFLYPHSIIHSISYFSQLEVILFFPVTRSLCLIKSVTDSSVLKPALSNVC